jgi:hypothetical protein
MAHEKTVARYFRDSQLRSNLHCTATMSGLVNCHAAQWSAGTILEKGNSMRLSKINCGRHLADFGSYHVVTTYMQFAVLSTSFAVMGYKALHGVTWRYMALHGHLVCCQQL